MIRKLCPMKFIHKNRKERLCEKEECMWWHQDPVYNTSENGEGRTELKLTSRDNGI